MKSRTLNIMNYLNQERMASYKEIAEAVSVTERAVRYDIDSINAELSFRKLPVIDKLAKGMLLVPDQLDLSVLCADQEYIYSTADRIGILRMTVLFQLNQLNLTKLCEKMQISRRCIQNDMEDVQKQFHELGLELTYDRKYQLNGAESRLFITRSREMKKYIEALSGTKENNVFEKDICNMVAELLGNTDVAEIFKWMDETMEEMSWVLTDDSYCWYLARVIVFAWYLKSGMELPMDVVEEDNVLGNRIQVLAEVLQVTISEKDAASLSSFSRFVNKYVDLDVKTDFISVEDIAMYLVNEMKRELEIDFVADGILLKGLLNHLGPMLRRMKSEVQLNDKDNSFLPEEYGYVFEKLQEIAAKHEVLQNITPNEAAYLAVYFLGSIRRLQQNQYKTVLLICGFGYGTTAVVKDALLNFYQVFVRNSIPVHKTSHYEHWDEIDLVISTVKVKLPVKKPIVNVNVIFSNEDYVKLDLAGLRRKNTLTNLFAIERRLNFLEDREKEQVMAVIKEELGYREVRMPKKYYKLSDLLLPEDIRCVERIDEWQKAVTCCTDILEQHGEIADTYVNSILKSMEIQGFYSVTDQKFALLHGSETAGVKVSCMSLVISREPVVFGEKKVHLIFCLASRDKKEHIPAIIRMMRMIQMTEFVRRLLNCTSEAEAIAIIEECEKEVEPCYQS